MIIKKISGIRTLVNPLNVVTLSRYNNYLAFSTLKQKAEKYLCAAVAYRTLMDVNPYQLYSLKT
jgi:hypothetical protein